MIPISSEQCRVQQAWVTDLLNMCLQHCLCPYTSVLCNSPVLSSLCHCLSAAVPLFFLPFLPSAMPLPPACYLPAMPACCTLCAYTPSSRSCLVLSTTPYLLPTFHLLYLPTYLLPILPLSLLVPSFSLSVCLVGGRRRRSRRRKE